MYLRTMKAVIPVAGVGTRLRPHTYTQPKPLIPVAGKPIICNIVDELLRAGVQDFVFIIGYLGEKIKEFIEKQYPSLAVTFVEQAHREGTGHAIWTARDALRDESEILIVMGDTVTDLDLRTLLNAPRSCFGVKEVNDPREFGVVELDTEGVVIRMSEKPRIPKSNLALVGLYKIKEVNILLEALEDNILHNRRFLGEFQLTDALMRMVEQGVQFKTVRVNNWFDCGKKEILLETNRILLDRKIYNAADEPAYDNTILIHPISIGEGCTIKDCIIGPHVAIGDNTIITSSIVSNSIIGAFSTLEDVILSRSIIGSDTYVKGIRKSLNIGDNTEIEW